MSVKPERARLVVALAVASAVSLVSTAYVDHGFARVNTDVRGSGMSGGALCLLCMDPALPQTG